MIKIGFVGDINPGGEFYLSGRISPDVQSVFREFDIRVATLESSFGNGNTLCHIKSNDPKLGNIIFSPDESIKVLKDLGIDVVSLANNHVCDLDRDGLIHTIDLLDKNNIAHFGAGKNQHQASEPVIINKKGTKICFLGYFPPEWEAPYPPDDLLAGLNHFYLDKVISDVKTYKKICNYVFVMPHWGQEHTRFPLVNDVINAKKIIEAGATAVIGSHTHTVQPIIKYKCGIIATSLGNFIFPDRYIVPPRLTYYPNIEERGKKNIPITYSYPIVQELTFKKIPQSGRQGTICEVVVDESFLAINRLNTILDDVHVLKIHNQNFKVKVQLFVIGLLIRWTFVYRVVVKFKQIFNSKQSKNGY